MTMIPASTALPSIRCSRVAPTATSLVQQVFPDHDALVSGVLEIAAEIASKSPLAIWGTKVAMNYARDHAVDDALDQIATWQAGMFQPDDMAEAFTAKSEKRPAVFPDLLPEPKGL